MKNPFQNTFMFFSKIALSCLLLELFFEKYFDINKFPSSVYPTLHWFANFVIYYPYSYLMLYLKNSNYLENRKVKHKSLTKNMQLNLSLKEILHGEILFILICHMFNIFYSNKISTGNIFQKLGWFYLCLLIADILFYAFHYALHKTKLYRIHKKHHQEINVNGFSSEIKSVYESLINIFIDLFIFIVLGRDMNQFISWIIIGVLYNVEGHSSMKLFYINSAFHINHHIYIDYNFGIGFYLDYVFGTIYDEKPEQKEDSK